jgi:naphthoate synthase
VVIGWHNEESCTDIKYESSSGIANVTINRTEARDTFRSEILLELSDALEQTHKSPGVDVGISADGGHMACCCDLTNWADNALFGRTNPRLGSCGDRYGASLPFHKVGVKMAKENWFLTRWRDAKAALSKDLCNTVAPLEKLERETVGWATEITALSTLAPRVPKVSFNAQGDGMVRMQQLAAEATFLFYRPDKALESPDAYAKKCSPDFGEFSGRP